MTPKELANRLSLIDTDAIARAALASSAADLVDEVRAALSIAPGGPHDHPWLRTGALRNSVVTDSENDTIVVASTSQVAVWQEHGTTTTPPRPSFGPAAARNSQGIAHAVAEAVAQALRSH